MAHAGLYLDDRLNPLVDVLLSRLPNGFLGGWSVLDEWENMAAWKSLDPVAQLRAWREKEGLTDDELALREGKWELRVAPSFDAYDEVIDPSYAIIANQT